MGDFGPLTGLARALLFRGPRPDGCMHPTRAQRRHPMQTTRSTHRSPARPHHKVRKRMPGGRLRSCTCIHADGLARDLPMNLWQEVQRSQHQCSVHGRGKGSVRLKGVHRRQG